MTKTSRDPRFNSNSFRRHTPTCPDRQRGRYTIADDEAVEVLVDKLTAQGLHQQRREKLMKALGDASQHYNTATDKERKAFFHGLRTGYAVALKLW